MHRSGFSHSQAAALAQPLMRKTALVTINPPTFLWTKTPAATHYERWVQSESGAVNQALITANQASACLPDLVERYRYTITGPVLELKNYRR